MTPAELEVPSPGWYADPAGAEATFRWWDGAGWTEWMSADPDADDPATAPAETAPADPTPATTAGPEVGPDLPPPVGRPVRVFPPGYERRTPERAAGADRGGPRAPRVLGGLAVLAAVAVVVAVVIYGNRAPADPLAAPLAPTTGSAGPTGSAGSGSSRPSASSPVPSDAVLTYDAATKTVAVGTFTAKLPGEPYRSDSPRALPGILADGVEATAVVQRKFDGATDWTAGVAIGRIDVAAIQGDDAEKTARNVFDAFVRYDLSGRTYTVSKITNNPAGQSGIDRAAIVQGQVNYTVKGVDSRFSRVSVLAAKLTDGTWVAWMSIRPDKASGQTKSALQASINSIRT